MDKCKNNYTNKLARKLSELRSTNSKEYWKILNSTNKNKKCAVDVNEMFQFMKDLNAGDCDDEFIGNSGFSYTVRNDEIYRVDESLNPKKKEKHQ